LPLSAWRISRTRFIFRQSRSCLPISSNAIFQLTTVLVALAHLGALFALWFSPSGSRPLFVLNAFIACAVLLYAATRVPYIWAGRDKAYVGLIGFELLLLVAAFLAFKGQRIAAVGSYVGFGLHGLVSLAAVVFAFAFKMRLM
jgi:hypothetical protein